MLQIVGYYDWQAQENSVSDQDFFVHCCGRYRLIQKERMQTIRPHGSVNYQLIYIADGKARFKFDGTTHILEKGTCVLFRPQVPQYYYYLLEEHPDIYWVHFSCHEDSTFLKNTGWGYDTIYSVGVHNSYLKLFDAMIHELQLKEPFCEEQLQLLMQQLLLQMSRNQLKSKTPCEYYNKAVEEAIQLFHLTPDKYFTIKQYVKEKGLNYYRFINTFTQYAGTSPRQYIINIRMTMAKELLANSLFNISEIAQLTGYDNPLYFSRLFKKTWGMSPTEYHKRYGSTI